MAWIPTVAIIGTGFGGICMAIQLKEQLGLTSFTIYEKENEIGGTWLVNTYPGCACDVVSQVYSFSFALNPNWSRKYAPAKEIHEYLQGVVNNFNIRQYIKFNTEVIKAEWDTAKQEWELTIKHNDKIQTVAYNILIIGSGPLRIPNIPEKLVSNFDGEWLHTAKWREDVDLSNKNVAVIGNGASAVQVIPNIAPDVNQLYVYQRTPSWIFRKNDFTYSDTWKRLFRWSPKLQRACRWLNFMKNELSHRVFARNYFLSKVVTKFARRFLFERFLERNVPVASIRAKLMPNYEPGCKRIILSDDFHKTFLRPNVHLVTEPIAEVAGNVIYSGEGTQTKVDAIILATGFRPDLFIAPMKIIGRQGEEIGEKWEKDKPEAYYGFCCRDYPNSFILLGPNSGLGHNSVVFMIECQVAAIINIVKEMMENNIASVEVKSEVQKEYNEHIQRHLVDTVWASGCKSWYYTEQKGNYSLWPHSCIEFWRKTRQIPMSDFDIVRR